jgi:carboxymethylenebutenolidase
MTSTRIDSVTVADGAFDLDVWLPETGHGPGLLLIPEIFGVGSYIKAVGERLAAIGYVVAAPEVFWRIERHFATEHDQAGLETAIAMIGKFDFEKGVADLEAAYERLGEMPEVTAPRGVIGFCFGGRMAYALASRVDPAVVVSYYGSGIAPALGEAAGIHCPIQFHFGESDPYIPNEEVAAITSAMEGKDNAEVHVQAGAGHAFDNHEAAMFHHPDAAKAAWSLTTGFLERHLPTS